MCSSHGYSCSVFCRIMVAFTLLRSLITESYYCLQESTIHQKVAMTESISLEFFGVEITHEEMSHLPFYCCLNQSIYFQMSWNAIVCFYRWISTFSKEPFIGGFRVQIENPEALWTRRISQLTFKSLSSSHFYCHKSAFILSQVCSKNCNFSVYRTFYIISKKHISLIHT